MRVLPCLLEYLIVLNECSWDVSDLHGHWRRLGLSYLHLGQVVLNRQPSEGLLLHA